MEGSATAAGMSRNPLIRIVDLPALVGANALELVASVS